MKDTKYAHTCTLKVSFGAFVCFLTDTSWNAIRANGLLYVWIDIVLFLNQAEICMFRCMYCSFLFKALIIIQPFEMQEALFLLTVCGRTRSSHSTDPWLSTTDQPLSSVPHPHVPWTLIKFYELDFQCSMCEPAPLPRLVFLSSGL